MKSICFGLAILLFAGGFASAAADALPPLGERELKFMKGIGATLDANGNIVLDKATIDRRTKTISFPAELNIRQGAIEALITTRKGRVHESLFISELDPFRLQLALILAGYRNGPMLEGMPIPQGAKFDVLVKTEDGKIRKADEWLYNNGKKTPKADDGYVFVGSNFTGTQCVASLEGNTVNINSGDSCTILNAVLNANNINDEYAVVTNALPPENKGLVTLYLKPFQPSSRTAASQPPPKMPTEDAARKLLEAVTFTGKNILYDYQRLEPAIIQPIPSNNKEKAARILAMKQKLTADFLKLYQAQKSHELYIKVDKIRVRLNQITPLYQEE